MILLDKVSKAYGSKTVVNKLSMEVNDGEICALIGPSGCGKTTTLRMINRLIEPTQGKIIINGDDISKLKPEILRRSIGYAIQMVGLFPHMTVAANISIVPEMLKWEKKRIQERISELLSLVGLSENYRSKYPNELSGGEAQRVGVARALAANPPIMLMDEPFGAVDPLTREKLQTQFLGIQKELKKTIILVTHDLDEAIRLADRIAIMKDGELIQYDTPEFILSKPANKFIYSFIGTDRALKSLSRISIEKFIKPSPAVNINASPGGVNKACKQCQWVWVIDDEKKLLGWIDRTIFSQVNSVDEAMVEINPEEISVNKSSSLKEALSLMLSQGMRTIPVVDEQGTLLGEIDMSDIEKATLKEEHSS